MTEVHHWEITVAQALLEKHLISPTKKEVVDTRSSTMTNCTIPTVLMEGTTVRITTSLGPPNKIMSDICTINKVLRTMPNMAKLISERS